MGCDRHDAQELPHALAGARVIRPIGFDAVAGGAVTLSPGSRPTCRSSTTRAKTRRSSVGRTCRRRSRPRTQSHCSTSRRPCGRRARPRSSRSRRPTRASCWAPRRCSDVDHRRRQALIGYWLRARGSAPGGRDRCGRSRSRTGRSTALDLDEVYADVLRGNDASTRVLERCGYEARAEGSCTQRGLSLPSTRYVRRAG